ncbi:sialate O-acetylesterase [Spirosoma soli]|uniref:Sialate O-acetylesterase n=1 Tax=Spirosoma soli TaxID=1770529 RepID=A0ABW5M121_9BACT
MLVRYLCLCLLFCSLVRNTFGQSGITFTQLPEDYQLFARDSTNQASVVIAGTASNAQPERLSVQVWRENQKWAHSVVSLSVSRPATFSTAVQIRAEKAQYLFRVYAHTGRDSTLLVERKRVVGGDFIQIYGQSNAAAFNPLYVVDDTYLRNFAFVDGPPPTDGLVRWFPSSQPYGGVGVVGWRLQELILEQFGIPTCIINGAVGGAGIIALNARNAANPADLNNPYGRLLFRHQRSQALKSLRAIIWKQGEAEAGGGFNDGLFYSEQFDLLYKYWQQDYGPKPRIYLGQVNYLPDPNSRAGGVRDFQRRTKSLYPNIETIATVGTAGFDGIHYETIGNVQIANELFRQIARDLYRSPDTLQINSPDIQRAYYTPGRDSLMMVFNQGMQMIWPADSTLRDRATGASYQRRMADYIYLDGQAGLVKTGAADRNRVILALTQPASATGLTYLPPFLIDNHTTYYDGVHLKNGRGMRAFTFENVAIGTSLPVVQLRSGRLVGERTVQLDWDTPQMTLTGYELERSDNVAGHYRAVGWTNGGATAFVDSTIPSGTVAVFYRLRALTATAESPVSAALRVNVIDNARSDLQLTMNSSTRVPKVGAPIRITLTALNRGPAAALNTVIENRLPDQMTFVAGNAVTHSAGVVSTTIASLTVGQAVSVTYTVSAQQPGRYINAAQIVQSDQPDTDSKPGSGTGDGEDDAALLDLRTNPAADTVFASPNPNQQLAAPVIPDQPSPVTDQADLSLHMVASTLSPRLNDVISFTLTVTNTGGAAVKLTTLTNDLPAELEYIASDGWQVSAKRLTTELPPLPAGESRNVEFKARAIKQGRIMNQAEISSSSMPDADSTPGNGTTNGEDDTAQVTIRVR